MKRGAKPSKHMLTSTYLKPVEWVSSYINCRFRALSHFVPWATVIYTMLVVSHPLSPWSALQVGQLAPPCPQGIATRLPPAPPASAPAGHRRSPPWWWPCDVLRSNRPAVMVFLSKGRRNKGMINKKNWDDHNLSSMVLLQLLMILMITTVGWSVNDDLREFICDCNWFCWLMILILCGDKLWKHW